MTHSFPTRRASDLYAAAECLRRGGRHRDIENGPQTDPDIFEPFALSLSKDRSSRKTVLRHARRERKKKTTGFEVQPGGGRSKSSGSRCSDRLRSSSLRAGIACASRSRELRVGKECVRTCR